MQKLIQASGRSFPSIKGATQALREEGLRPEGPGKWKRVRGQETLTAIVRPLKAGKALVVLEVTRNE